MHIFVTLYVNSFVVRYEDTSLHVHIGDPMFCPVQLNGRFRRRDCLSWRLLGCTLFYVILFRTMDYDLFLAVNILPVVNPCPNFPTCPSCQTYLLAAPKLSCAYSD